MIFEPSDSVRERIIQILSADAYANVYVVNEFHVAARVIQSQHPNLLFVRHSSDDATFDRIHGLISRIKQRTVLIPIVENPSAEQLKHLANLKGVNDVLTAMADNARLHAAIKKANETLSGASDKISHYRGFVGFVGVTPSLRERKILTTANLGIIHNRSPRLAIDYWRNNPSSQLIAVALNVSETFSSRPDEVIEYWESYELMPWEIAMYEAQQHYMQYWKDAINDDLLPSAIPTLLKHDANLTPIDPAEQREILMKINKMTQRGELQDTFHSMGVAFRVEGHDASARDFDRCVEKMQKKLEAVDQQHPELTRPPEETGYENFKPDKAKKSARDDSKRMAFTSRNR
ncbi:MAG: hypothetical protein GC154_18725 [bacterium]|nr:hypothetical protein [bacterium]